MGAQWKQAGREANAQKKGQMTAKLVREILVATKLGGADPELNPRLAAAVEKARKASVYRDTIERAIARGVLMFGDGLNDAGALRSAAVGIAVTEDTSAFTPACDGILHGGQLPRVSRFLAAARRARTVVYLSFGISIIYNILGLSLAATGHLSPLASAILMPVGSVSVILFATGTTWLAARREGLV